MALALEEKFRIVETAAFDEWKRAGPKKREDITKAIGEWEAREIIKQIEAEANKKYTKKK